MQLPGFFLKKQYIKMKEKNDGQYLATTLYGATTSYDAGRLLVKHKQDILALG